MPSRALFVAPSASEGSLGTCMPRDDTVGNAAPRRKPRGLPGDAVPNEVRGDAVPTEVRDATACARQDKKRRSAGQSRGTF